VRLLHGKPLADRIHERSRERSAALSARGITPRLAAVSVGADPAAHTYVQRLLSRGTRLGIAVDEVGLARDASEREVVAALNALDSDASVHGILLLTPLPTALDEAEIVGHLATRKDVEGMSPESAGLLVAGRPRFVPSTADAVIELLKFYDVPLRGARVTVVGRSPVVGRPAALLLVNEDATVTIAHSRTQDLGAATSDASVVVIAIGRAGFLRGDMIAPGATVIDAGINMTPRGIVGDVDTQSVSLVAGALSPVPGGLGAVTTELLLRNVLTATERQQRD
jgi:methylenetetrahydrofolate dehydrogenase (NADP+) / methenyltetrahydrofolate cyclohydrolase